ncbi:UDP-glucuronosyltransferase [Negadavirga shengliensis]|uniref:UDP-glucuronosyltransferase n=1 Tax=Negadavirga shengliensis TaxID=1389218 RepID=A0ABV9SXX4_9BACT
MDFEFTPDTYFDGTGPSTLIAKLTYPESQWGEEICIFASSLDGKILYDVVDFYGNDYHITPETSDLPITLQELIVMIESLEVNAATELGHINTALTGIPQAESLLYKDLELFFNEKRKHFGFI